MDQKSDVILQNIDDTRSALAEKIELLEDQMKDKVENAKATVEETIDGIKQKVETTVGNVKQNLSLSYQVQQHPWTMVGASVATGILVGRHFSRNRDGYRYAPAVRPSSASDFESRPLLQALPPRPSFLNTLAEDFKPEIQTIKGLAVGMAITKLGEVVKKNFPSLSEMVDEVISSSDKVGPNTKKAI